VGASLFVVGASLPFVAQAVVVAAGVLLVVPLRLPALLPPGDTDTNTNTDTDTHGDTDAHADTNGQCRSIGNQNRFP
jgi:hypothetical protein